MFDRKLWADRFTKLPSWPCPRCHHGRLQVIKETFDDRETLASKEAHGHEAWDPDWIEKRFSAHLTCSEENCGEGAVVIGTTRVDMEYGYDYDGNTITEVIDFYFPEIIHPSPLIIHVAEEAPEEIRDEIRRASALVWVDAASSANKLRLAAERILTALGVKRTKTIKGKRRPISLSERIDLIGKTDSKISDLLHSIRFLGNHASHESLEDVDRNDLLSAFEIIEHVIDHAFSTKTKRLMSTAKDLRKRKGKPKSAKKRI